MDKHACFADLSLHEPHGAWRIHREDRGSDVLVAAPHGGPIEHHTMEIARAIAGDDLSYYVFEGRKAEHNYDLHVTSTNFDEPAALAMAAGAALVLTVHGRGAHDETAWIGGRHAVAVEALVRELRAAGFDARVADAAYAGRDPRNLCNRGALGGGVQLELGSSLRHRLAGQAVRRAAFVKAVRDALDAALATAH